MGPYTSFRASFFGVAVDDEFVYWTQSETEDEERVPVFEPGRIGRVAKDGDPGPNPDFIAPADPAAIGRVRAIAVDTGHIYWLDSGSSPSLGRVGRAGIDGSGVNSDFVPDVLVGNGIALDNSFIYFTDGYGPISRVALAGSGPVQEFVPSSEDQLREGLYVTWASGSLTPTELDFDPTQVDSDQPTFGFLTLTSTDGNVPLRIAPGGISITGVDAGDFSIGVTSCETGITTLFPDQSCTVEVAFEPTTVGSKSAILQIATNDGEFTAGLSGTGTEAPDPGPTPEPSFTALKLTSKAKRVRAPRKGRKTIQARVRVTNSGDAAGTATVTLRSSSRKVRVPGQVRIQVGPGSSKARSFKVTIRSGAPRKAKLTARSGGGGGGKATFSELTITITKPPKK